MLDLVYLLQLTGYLLIVETGMIALTWILIGNIVIGIRVENIEAMIIEVPMHIKLVVLTKYAICVIDLIILLFIAGMLNVMLVVCGVMLGTAS